MITANEKNYVEALESVLRVKKEKFWTGMTMDALGSTGEMYKNVWKCLC